MNRTVRPSTEWSEQRHWDCVHRCPQCGNITKLGDLDLKATTTGIAACPICTWTGQIQILIVERPQSVLEISIKEEDSRGFDRAVELATFNCEDVATNNGKG